MAKTLSTPQETPQGVLLPAGVTEFFKRRACEMAGLLLIALGCALIAALLSFSPSDPSLNNATDIQSQNLLGGAGAIMADIALQTFGVAAALPAITLIAWGLRLFAKQSIKQVSVRSILLISSILLVSIAASTLSVPGNWPLMTGLGGFTGQALFNQLVPIIQMVHAAYGPAILSAVCGGLATAILIYVFGWSMRDWRYVAEAFQMTFVGFAGAITYLLQLARFPHARKIRILEFEAGENDILDREPAKKKSARKRIAKSLIEPKKAKPKAGRKATKERQSELDLGDDDDYHLPPLSLLEETKENPASTKLNKAALEQNASFLSSTLEDFGIRGDITKVRPGPVVTLYELEPAPGTKTSRVVGLSDDVARSMSAISVRVAVVPGRSVIGIELPNATREMVGLREILASESFEKAPGKLPLILGKDIGGSPICVDLARMPHLLIAGTTGSGKSVGMNAMILSLLYRMHPDECKFIMIDPKMLELSVYDGIPHLLSPVVTDPSKAVVALKWTVREMEDRYRCMSQLGVRNIAGFNARLEEANKKGETLTRRVQTGFDEGGIPIYEDQPIANKALPYIVVVVDEMADLMLVAGKDVEAAIQRLAQMARAAGIHIIMATQRPSVDVITGTIKANFPTRISFQVTSKIDSRTILGEQGAENLLGQGDMLYMAGGGRISRVHGPFVSDEEVEQIVAHISAQGTPDYIESVTEGDDDPFSAMESSNAPSDELYDKAVAIIASEGKASTSFIQRHLQIGYNRAARIIEQMEKEGVVSPANRVGRREVLIGNH
ncbi:MAG: cell division protein FtsK [Rhodospirillales bacterium]|jgi:DNA segregation ATPase FtsK/SpoIIIE, S-DNA-T family|nr:cell division protein FtsK [Rhodospirillales bacterium]